MDANTCQDVSYFVDNTAGVMDYYNMRYYTRPYFENIVYATKDNTEIAMRIALKIIKSECLKMSVNQFCNLVNSIKEEL